MSKNKVKNKSDKIGNLCIELFNYIGLFAIGGVVVWASVMEFLKVIQGGAPNIENILMLFIYLELGAMVGIYFKTNHLPIRFLLYIGITAMIRHLIGVITEHGNDIKLIGAYTIGIFILCISVLVIRIGSNKYPTPDDKKEILTEDV